jgi:Fis family transcriptional regulator
MTQLNITEAVHSQERAGSAQPRRSLAACVRDAIDGYFSDLHGHDPRELYSMVISEVERPLLESVMRQVQGNQTRAAQILGINRSTLRKKLAQYGLND